MDFGPVLAALGLLRHGAHMALSRASSHEEAQHYHALLRVLDMVDALLAGGQADQMYSPKGSDLR